jgi:hypothetical protein
MIADRAKELMTLDIWKELLGELDKAVMFETSKLLTCKPEELPTIQARVMALQRMARLPQEVIDREE